jgi:hypothetical protein
MADHLVVQIREKVGLDWADELSEMLQQSTGLRWVRDPEREKAATGDAQGVDTIILVAALSSVVDSAVKALLHSANEAAKEWRKRRLDAPEVDVVHEGGDTTDAAGAASGAPHDSDGD